MREAGAKPRWRRLRWVLIAAAALLVLLAGAWYSGYPQEWAAEWAIKRDTGLIAQVDWGGEFPELRLESMHLYATREAYRRKRPLVSAYAVTVQYSLLARDRKLKKVSVGQLLVDADPYSQELRDLPIFASDSGKEPSGPIDPTLIPLEISVEGFAVRLHSEGGMFFLADSISISADLTDPETIGIRAGSNYTDIVYGSGDGARMKLENIEIDGQGRYVSGRIDWTQTIAEEGLIRLAFDIAGTVTGEAPQLDVNVRECSVDGERVGAVLESIRAPVRFAALEVTSAKATIGLGESAASSLEIAARVYAPGLRGAAEPLYTDAVALTMTAVRGERLQADATLAFAQGQRATASLRGTSDEGEAAVEIAGWSRAQLIDAVPEAFRGSVSGLRFDAFASQGTLKWTKDAYRADARAESRGGGAGAEPIAWLVQATGSRDGSAAIEGTAEARIGDRRVHGFARYESADHYLAEAVIEEVQIAPWVQLFAGEDAAALTQGTIQGTIRAEAKGEDAPIEIRPEIALEGFRYDELALDQITAHGVLEYAQAEGRLAIAEFLAEAPDGMTGIVLTNWEYETESEVGGGAITIGADLGIVGRLIGEPELFGNATVEGTVRAVGPRKEFDFTVMSDYLGLGEVMLPYGTKLTGEGNIEYNDDSDAGRLRGVEARIGEGTVLRLGDTRFVAEHAVAEGTATLESDLQVLVGMGWLSEAQGRAEGEATFRVADGALHADWIARMDAPSIVLAESAGFAEAVAFDGRGAYTEGLSGTGTVRAGKLMAAGGSITNAAGPVLFDGELMRIQQAQGDLFRGRIRADVDVGVLQEGLPIRLDGSFENVDLAIFTDEVQPPKTQLTGTAQGRMSAEYSTAGLTAFTFEAESPGRLSVNRSLVEELLQSDKFLSGAGANVAERAMDKLLGTAPQRPFDRGRLNVELAGDKITGLAVLESEQTRDYHGLNLRISLDMDESALAEALKMLQETSMTTVDF